MILAAASSPALPASLSGRLRACKQGLQLVSLDHLFLDVRELEADLLQLLRLQGFAGSLP
jgi:hypothetical protein